MISHHAALIYTMVLVSAADRDMTDAELRKMGEVISGLRNPLILAFVMNQ